MKTSELRKVVEENLYEFQKTEDFIYIRHLGLKKMILDLRNNSITVGENTILVTQSIKKIMVALIEYSLTPLNEREDEKKYQLKVNEFNKRIIDVDYIEQISTKIKGTPEGNQKFIFDNKDIFTQSEIDNFPAEIKGAIACGFLKKVEVKE